MSKSPRHMKDQSHLRLDAETRLRDGIAPRASDRTLNADVLELLYKLASNPDSAPDALKLLHELQVHQVELDLQLNQLESADREISEELTRYRGLFDFAPVGYLILGHDGRIIESNVLGSKLLGVEPEELGGRFADSLLAPESRSSFTGLLKNLRDGGQGGGCTVRSDDSRGARRLQLSASMTPSGEGILVAVTELA